MRQRDIMQYRDMFSQHKALYLWLSDISEASTASPETADLVDMGFAMNEAMKLLDDAVKTVRKAQNDIAIKICKQWLVDSTLSGGEDTNIKTEYTTATPKPTTVPDVPSLKSNPEQFADMMRTLGVPEHLWQTECIRPHYPGLVEFHNQHVNRGGREFLDTSKAKIKFKVLYYKRKGLEND